MPVGRPDKSFPAHLFVPPATSGDGDGDAAGSSCGHTRDVGRSKEQLRKLFVKCGVVSQAEGSAYMECGNTKILCSVSGPKEIPRGDENSTLLGVVDVSARFASFARQSRTKRPGRLQDLPTDEELVFQNGVNDALKSCIMLEKFPNAQIDVFLTILEDDGGVLPTAVSCTSLALVDAGIEVFDLIVGSSLIMRDGDFFLDPTKAEESFLKTNANPSTEAGALVVCGFMPSLNQMTAFNHTGLVSVDAVKTATKLLTASCTEIHKVLSQELLRRTKQAVKL